VRGALLVAAALLIGSGVGLLVGDAVPLARDRLPSLLLVQPLIVPLATALALAGGARRPLAVAALSASFASASSLLALQVALLLLRGHYAMLPPRGVLSPQGSVNVDMVVLLALSYAITSGHALLISAFSRALSPLWLGLEALPTPLEAPRDASPRAALAGAPLGALLAWLDARQAQTFSGTGAPPFGLGLLALFSLTLPVSSALTFSLHALLLQLVGSSDLTQSIAVGVQLGVAISTVVAAAAAYTWGGTRMFPRLAAELLPAMLGVFLLLLSYAALAPAYAVYLLASSVALSALTVTLAVRLEGGFFALYSLAEPRRISPALVNYAWLTLSGLLEGLGLSGARDLLQALANPALMLMVAVVVTWVGRFERSVAGDAVLLAALGAPLLLVLARVSTGQGFPEGGSLARGVTVDGSLRPEAVAAAAILAAAGTLLLHYTWTAEAAESRLRFVRLLADPSGLLFAYYALPLHGRETATVALAAIAAFSVLRAALHELGRPLSTRGYAHGALVTYGAYALAAVLQLTLRALGL